ncbi:hypothetical protein KFL_000660230 [Klebsormidium nitens]|uniref:Uncharacterized protein n=1 Tax=Klebsormidium nitens TaxID=105231 RepID=A0A1Y1HYI9_KLENI|nr:hypothetical protein KFL_000660230 [Klebsormidium nitens]|eukprot:GAQ80928.1 hypothetical protein KFL_000660230 [Klebsormidium nitens]
MQEAVQTNPQTSPQPWDIGEGPVAQDQQGQPNQLSEGVQLSEPGWQQPIREASEKDLTQEAAEETPVLPQQPENGKRGRDKKAAGGEQPTKKPRGGKKKAAKELTEEEKEQLAAGKEVYWQLQKMKRVMKQYEGDKQTNERSGSGRANSCPFYEQMDAFFGTKATVNCAARLSSTAETPGNAAMGSVEEGSNDVKAQGSGKADRKKSAQVDAMKEVMEDVIENTTGRVVDALTQASSGTQKVMEGMRSDINNFMGRLLDILERDGL